MSWSATSPITASVERALDGCTAVVHAAALVSLAERDAARAEAVNVGGTRLVVGGAAERSITAVHVSSVSVFGTGHSPITIDSPLAEARGGYTRSKVAAERFVRELQDQGAPVAVVYPSGVLGPDAPDLGSTYLGLVGWVRTPPKTILGLLDRRRTRCRARDRTRAGRARRALDARRHLPVRTPSCTPPSRASPAFTGARCPLPERRSASPAEPVIS